MLEALTVEAPEGTGTGGVPSLRTLQGSDLWASLASWATPNDPYRSQSPLLALAVSKNCPQINYASTKLLGRFFFLKKSLTWGIRALGRHWHLRCQGKSTSVYFAGTFCEPHEVTGLEGRCGGNTLWKHFQPEGTFLSVRSYWAPTKQQTSFVLTGTSAMNKADFVCCPHGIHSLDHLCNIIPHFFFQFCSE